MAGMIMKIERSEYLALLKENQVLKAENSKLSKKLAEAAKINEKNEKAVKKGVNNNGDK